MMGKRLLAIALSIVLSVMLCPALALAKSDGALTAASDPEFGICYVTYDDGLTDPTTVEYNYGTEATVADAPVAPKGRKFLYWYQDRGTDPVYPGDKFTVTGDTVFHAQWEELVVVDECSLTYHPNFEGMRYVVEQVEPGATVTLKDCMYTRSGYEFLGWSDMADGTARLRLPGDEMTVEGDTVLYAQWAEVDDLAIVDAPKPFDGLVYNGKMQVGVEAGPMYTVRSGSARDAGSYTAILTLKKGAVWSDFTTEKKYVEWGILPAKNAAKVAKTSVSKQFKAKAMKKSAKTFALPKVTCDFGTAKWSVVAKDSKQVLSLDVKTGKVKVKKGAKKGTYTMKVQASVKATDNYGKASTKVVTVKVTVK